MTSKEAIGFLIKDKEQRGDCFISDALDMAIKALKQERKKAKWIKGFDDLTCSRCGERLYAEQTYIHKNFCPNCGAEMER